MHTVNHLNLLQSSYWPPVASQIVLLRITAVRKRGRNRAPYLFLHCFVCMTSREDTFLCWNLCYFTPVLKLFCFVFIFFPKFLQVAMNRSFGDAVAHTIVNPVGRYLHPQPFILLSQLCDNTLCRLPT